MKEFKYIKINNYYGIIFHNSKKSVIINNYNNNSKKDLIKAIEAHVKSNNDVTFINGEKNDLLVNDYGNIVKVNEKITREEMIILDVNLFLHLVNCVDSIRYENIKEYIFNNLDIIKVGV